MPQPIIERIPDKRPNQLYRLLKPRQVREFPKWCLAIKKALFEGELDGTTVVVGEKADGHSVTLQCFANGEYRVVSRTENAKVLLAGHEVQRYITQVACTLQARFTCELRALYEGRELGFLEVLAMVKRFRESHTVNVAPFQLQLCIFGVYSVNPEGFAETERQCSFLPPRVLEDLLRDSVVPGNPLVTLAPTTEYRVRLYDRAGRGARGLDAYELEFLCDGRTVARTPKEFFDALIRQADAAGIEGYVLKADPRFFKRLPVVANGFGVRDQSAVKVKREFKVTLLACRVFDRKRKLHLLYTYGLDTAGSIVYAGEQTGHARLEALLPKTGRAFAFLGKPEREALYTLTRERVGSRLAHFVMVSSSCTNMSKNRFAAIGLKIHDMVARPVDLDALSVLQRVAEANPHFRSTKAAGERFAQAIGRGAPSTSHRKRKTQGGSPPPERRVRQREAPASLAFDDFAQEIGEPPASPGSDDCGSPPPEQVPERGGEQGPEQGPERPPEVDHQAAEDAAFGGYLAFLDGPRTEPRPLPYRVCADPIAVHIDTTIGCIGPLRLHLLTLKIRFLGGVVARELGPHVRAVVTSGDDNDFMTKHSAHLRRKCAPAGIAILTHDEVQAFLRP